MARGGGGDNSGTGCGEKLEVSVLVVETLLETGGWMMMVIGMELLEGRG